MTLDLDTLTENAPALTQPHLDWLRDRLQRREKLVASGKPHDRLDAQIERRLERHMQTLQARVAHRPELSLPAALPVSAAADEIVEALAAHQVLVVAGDTGSGKSTQLPKLCLSAGRGIAGRIGHTQPRRLAARSLAARLAEETVTQDTDCVGHQVRFSDTSGPGTRVKLMTDGILLAEISGDPLLSDYDTLIIDEAHERSLNIDFILGHLKLLLPKRPDLKLIVTSATIDVERLADFFEGAHVLQVSGRTYPVDVAWLAPLDEASGERDLGAAVAEAIELILDHERQGGGSAAARDVLVFVPGEREIRDLSRELGHLDRHGFEILPLYARLPPSEQQRVFAPGGRRRIVLATNVAETSITVPRIGYVIDSGLVRMSRYDYRAKLQRLPIEPVSQASANQRAGRCGRIAPGLCIRLFDEQDFASRPEFTDPEIRRTNLAAVILQMKSARLGDPHRFPFMDPPAAAALGDGERLLQELQALDAQGELTPIGRVMARLPIDPRLARMLAAAAESGALNEALVICSGLAVQDPRLRPMEKRGVADEKHRQWRDENSDFLSWVRLWDGMETQRQSLSRSGFRRWAEKNLLSYNHLREWRETHRQIHVVGQDLGWRVNSAPADYAVLHQALLTGSLSLVGLRTEEGDYLGARGRRFTLQKNSAQAPARSKWIMVAELVETHRVLARTAARIDPAWLERTGEHLLRHHFGEPSWDEKRGEAMVNRRSSLFGLPVVENRRVALAPVDPARARALLIEQVLVGDVGQLDLPFASANRTLRRRIEQEEETLRRRDVVADDVVLRDFFDARLPSHLCSVNALRKWLRTDGDAALLTLDEATVRARATSELTAQDYPDSIEVAGRACPVKYRFDPTSEADGASLQVPVELLEALEEGFCSWPVPGFLEGVVEALLRGQPKQTRKRLAPLSETAQAATAQLRPNAVARSGALLQELAGFVLARFRLELDADAMQRALRDEVAPGLRLNLQLRSDRGRLVAQDRSLAALREKVAARSGSASRDAVAALEQRGLTSWSFGALPEYKVVGDGRILYPALEDRHEAVDLRWLPDRAAARRASLRGITRLIALSQRQSVRYLRKQKALAAVALKFAARLEGEDFVDGLVRLAIRELVPTDAWPGDPAAFAAACERVSPALVTRVLELMPAFEEAATRQLRLAQRLERMTSPAFVEAIADIRTWLARLFQPRWLDVADAETISLYPVLLEGVEVRLDQLQGNIDRDRRKIEEIRGLESRYEQLCRRAERVPWQTARRDDERFWALQWSLASVRTTLFAETVRIRRGPGAGLSAKKLRTRLNAIERELSVQTAAPTRQVSLERLLTRK